MKISVLTPDLSNNCLGRAVVLANLLERTYEVEVVGPKQGDGIWEPMRDEFEYCSISSGSRIDQFAPDIPLLLKKIDGDVVLASKPAVQSYGIGLLTKLQDDIPLVLDIDDWESGFKLNRGQLFAHIWGIPTLIQTDSFYYYRVLEALSDLADAQTVSNQFLQEKFGGEIIPHARDTSMFNPERFDKATARNACQLPESAKLIIFSGTPRQHKGVTELVQAVASINRDDVKLVVVGAQESQYTDELCEIGGESLILRGQQSFNEFPRWLAAADIAVIPQKRTPATQRQLPAKVFDMMAMAKPIIATRVGDLPEILDDTGMIIEPNSKEKIGEAISYLLDNKSARIELGRRARDRCVNKYSYDALAPKLAAIIEEVAN